MEIMGTGKKMKGTTHVFVNASDISNAAMLTSRGEMRFLRVVSTFSILAIKSPWTVFRFLQVKWLKNKHTNEERAG